MTQGLFNIIGENPEEKHISEEVEKSSMKEHRRDKSEEALAGLNSRWDQPKLKDKFIDVVDNEKLIDEYHYVYQDDADDRKGENAGFDIITER